jgi:hypothetical protein
VEQAASRISVTEDDGDDEDSKAILKKRARRMTE